MLHLRLMHFSEQNFRRNEVTNFNEACGKMKMGKKEAAMFVSKGHDQILFMFNPTKIGDRVIYESRRYRLSKGEWEILFIQYYARRVGIVFDGLEKLAQLVLKKFGPKAT